MKKVMITAQIPLREKTRLREMAVEKGVTSTQIIRSALKLYYQCNTNHNPCPACGTAKGKQQ
jgi:hypothetical protein